MEANENIYNNDDTLDINELAALNNDISPEFIEQLQNQVSQSANAFNGDKQISDADLFEEVPPNEESDEPSKENIKEDVKEDSSQDDESKEEILPQNTPDDNFIKKYKAKLNKQPEPVQSNAAPVEQKTESPVSTESETNNEIENLSSGNISEKPISQEQIDYNESLDYLDDNIKYKKYVIYINPENTEFMDSLTVKERKNLINRIIREQDDIAITKHRLGLIQTIIKHVIIAIVTLAIAVPVVYFTINASLEATINNYRSSQTIFKTLYKEKGKIKNNF